MKKKLYEQLKKIRLFRDMVLWIRWHSRKIKLGTENSDKVFYVIRRHDMHAGLFSFVMSNLGAVVEAEQKGYIPVIDMMNSANSMLEPDEIGKKNAWDDYFEQPEGVTLDEIGKSKNVILGSIHPPKKYPGFSMILNPEELTGWQRYASKYLKLNQAHVKAIQEYYDRYFADKRVLGVLCRGTDYVAMKPYHHPVQPDPEEVVRKCREIMKAQKCDCIYLATEDQKIWDLFQDEFHGIVYSYQKTHYQSENAEYIDRLGNSLLKPYERNAEYLVSIGILARCNCLVAGATNGSYGALLLTTGYEYQYIYQLGRYEKNK